jgi:hypothetical protein
MVDAADRAKWLGLTRDKEPLPSQNFSDGDIKFVSVTGEFDEEEQNDFFSFGSWTGSFKIENTTSSDINFKIRYYQEDSLLDTDRKVIKANDTLDDTFDIGSQIPLGLAVEFRVEVQFATNDPTFIAKNERLP